jgi:hypothetical protein
MPPAERQAARMQRLKQAEATLDTAKTAARMVYKWTDMLEMSLRHDSPGRWSELPSNSREASTYYAISFADKLPFWLTCQRLPDLGERQLAS